MDGNETSARPQDGNTARVFALAFAGLALACVIIGSYYVYEQVLKQKSLAEYLDTGPQSPADVYLTIIKAGILIFERFFPLLLISFFAFSFTRASISFVKSGEYGRTSVVPPRDFSIIGDAIKQGKPEPVDQYIRLASLRGGIGLFQKVGLTGLPLATLALVVFFALGVMFFDDKSDTFKAFLDFTKLMLGAFIGSFVQRQVERRSQESDIQRAIQTVTQTANPTPPPAPSAATDVTPPPAPSAATDVTPPPAPSAPRM